MIIGLMPFIDPFYAIAIGIAIFFGIKGFVQKRKQSMEEEIGEGFCAQCGERIVDKPCQEQPESSSRARSFCGCYSNG